MEYRIVIQKGNCKPFSLWTFSDFDSCYFKLLDLIRTQCISVNKFYYVTNSFFKNEYLPVMPNMTFYTIEIREVSDWKIYSKEKNKQMGKVISMF